MKENNGWISIKERLPDMHSHDFFGKISDPILLYGRHPEYNDTRVFMGFKLNDYFCSNDIDHEFDRCKITHWQPLPLPPKL